MARTAALAGFALLALAVAIAVARGKTDRQGESTVRPLAPIAVLAPGMTVCQAGERVPAGTGRLRFDATGASAVAVQVGAARGRVAAGWSGLVVPLAARAAPQARVCVTNEGPQALSLFGEATAPERAARLADAPLNGRIRVVYLRPRDVSWLVATPDVGERVAAVRGAAPGAATAYLWAVLALVAAAGSLLLVVRSARP